MDLNRERRQKILGMKREKISGGGKGFRGERGGISAGKGGERT